MEDRPIVLVGMMGSGKSAVGRHLAARLGRPFVDADEALEARLGRTIPEVFATEGEEVFRRHERDVLADLLGRRPAPVVASGGGVVLHPDNRRALRERSTVVWLQAPVDELARRVGRGTGRPLLSADPVRTLTELDARRAPLYAEVAGVVVDTAGRSAWEIAQGLTATLEASGDRTEVSS